MAFKDSFLKRLHRSPVTSISMGGSPSTEKSMDKPSKSTGMTAYLPSYQKQDSHGQDPNMGYEYKLPSVFLRKMYEKNVIVRSAVDTIINEVVSAVYTIKPKDETEEIDPEKEIDQKKRIKEIEEFFAHPNENSESFRIVLEKMMWDLLIFDAGVLEKVRNVGGDKLKEIYAIPGDTIRIKTDEHGKVLGYWQVLPGNKYQPKFFGKNDLIYIVMNPRSHTPYGFSALQTLENLVAAFIYSENYNVKYFENNATPRGILEVGAINEGQLDRFKEYWQQENLQQPHRVMVVSNPHAHEGKGGIKWIPLALNAKDMELMNYLNWLMKMILMVFGVTPAEVGFTDDLRGAPALGQVLQSQAFKNKAIYPMMDRISRFLTEEIISEEFNSDDLKFEFIEEKGIQEELQKAQLDSLLVQSQIQTVEEIRKERGLDTTPSGQEESGGGGLDDILSRLTGAPREGEMGEDMGADSSAEPTIVDTAFSQLKNTIYEELGLSSDIEANPMVAEKMSNAYGELKTSIEDHVAKTEQGQRSETNTGQLIEDTFHRLMGEIKFLTTKREIDSVLNGG